MQTGQQTRRAVHAVPSPDELPKEWGNPLWYYWTESKRGNQYYCRLCWKYVDKPHLQSVYHNKAQQNWEHRLTFWPEDPIQCAVRMGCLRAWRHARCGTLVPVTGDPRPGTTPDHSSGPERRGAPGSAGDQDTIVPPVRPAPDDPSQCSFAPAVLQAPADPFEGCWVNQAGMYALITRNTVDWRHFGCRESWAMRRCSGCNYFKVEVQGSEYTAWRVAKNDGTTQLQWSDGDLWDKVPIPPPPTQEHRKNTPAGVFQ